MGATPRWRAAGDGLLVAGLLLLAFVVVYAGGGSRTALPHAFYIPIVVAAVRLGWVGAGAGAVAAGILCGPLMPLDVATGTTQTAGNWLLRTAFFVAVALVAAAMTAQARRSVAREQKLAGERAELATARTTLLQIVSHELRTPLTILKGSLPVIMRRTDSPHQAALAPAIERAVRRLEDLAQVVYAVVEDGAGPGEAVEQHLRTLLEGVVADIGPEHCPGRVELTISTARTVITEPESFRLAVRWLTENALKFSPAGAPVEITARDRDGDIVIEIRDHGAGIPESFTNGNFPVMQQGDATTTRERGGLGLGLYATDRLVRRLGGRVTVERAQGPGTVATVRLPATRG